MSRDSRNLGDHPRDPHSALPSSPGPSPWSSWTALLAQASAWKEPCPPASPPGQKPHSCPMSKLP